MARLISVHTLPRRANLEHLKNKAKALLRSLRRHDPQAKLTTAQARLARSYGFASWRALKAHVEVMHAMPAAEAPAKARRDWKPIMDAAYAGDAKRVAALLEGGADPNARSTTGHHYRPLHRAIEPKKTAPRGPGHEQTVRVLLKRGADPTLRATTADVTALQLAAMGELRFVPLLIERFQPLDIWHAAVCLDDKRVAALLKKTPSLVGARDASGRTALHYCAASALYRQSDKLAAAQLRIANLLLDGGADVNDTHIWAGSKQEQWPVPVLYHACGGKDNPVLTELLLQRGANVFDGESIYHATDEGHDASLAVLERYAVRHPRELAAEATKILRRHLHWGRTHSLDWLLAHGADPDAPDPQTGNTALHEAARHGSNAKVIAALVAHGASPQRHNKAGKAPLDAARAAGKARVVKQLRAHV